MFFMQIINITTEKMPCFSQFLCGCRLQLNILKHQNMRVVSTIKQLDKIGLNFAYRSRSFVLKQGTP